MKKLLLVLMVVALASFLFVGCVPVTPAEGEGEGEGEGEVGVTVDIEGSVVIDGKTYVSADAHDITVTFPTPVEGSVTAVVGYCSGNYSKDMVDDLMAMLGINVVLFPNADKTVWTGSADFEEGEYDCCASYVMINSGACEDEYCIKFPVIVDADNPYAKIEITADDCDCGGCELTFESGVTESECSDDVDCCGDDCSGLASWAVAVYEDDPFNVCCDTPCKPEIGGDSGSACPIEFTTACLEEEKYWVVVTLVDNVGNEREYYATVELDTDCEITVTEYLADELGTPGNDCLCTEWDWHYVDTDDFIGFCEDVDNCHYED